ncbi:MAG: hypothetical protein K9G46_11265 [Flavobacteriales bacterium]|nr:hypothetical protein [Flavobacteriales bacterium]
MKSARIVALCAIALGIGLTQWAFRFLMPPTPVDAFIRLMMLVFDGFVLVFIFCFGWQNVPFAARLRQLLQQWPRLVAVFMGLFLAYCGFMAVEFACRFYFKHGYRAPYSDKTYWEPSASVQDSILGTALWPDTVISHALVVNDSLIYKKHYRIDALGRHITPTNDSARAAFAMVTGCSYVFGYANEENETLSYYLDSLTGLRGYNYGISGHGTQQTLAFLQSRNLHQEIKEPNGLLVHLFIDRHIQRLIGTRRLINLWASNFPYYYLDGEELKHDGSFLSGRNWLTRFYRAISQSSFIALFDIDVPWYVSDGHMKLFGAVLREAKREFLKQYPDGRFLVVLAPGTKLAPRALKVLNEHDIEVLDCSTLLNPEQKQYKIHWTEGHPNHKYYLEVAQEISGYLKTHPR